MNYENAGLQSPDDPVRTLNNFVTLNLTGSVNTEGWGLLPVHRWAVWQCCKARPLRGELATPRLPLACGQRRGRSPGLRPGERPGRSGLRPDPAARPLLDRTLRGVLSFCGVLNAPMTP